MYYEFIAKTKQTKSNYFLFDLPFLVEAFVEPTSEMQSSSEDPNVDLNDKQHCVKDYIIMAHLKEQHGLSVEKTLSCGFIVKITLL